MSPPRPLATALLPLVLLAACGGEPGRTPRCSAEPPTRLEGVWSGYQEGREQGEWTLLVTGTCFFLSGPGRRAWMKGAATFPEQGNEGPLDLWIEDCDCSAPGETALALFHLQDDELRIAGVEPGSRDRPASLDAPGARVFRFQRRSP